MRFERLGITKPGARLPDACGQIHNRFRRLNTHPEDRTLPVLEKPRDPQYASEGWHTAQCLAQTLVDKGRMIIVDLTDKKKCAMQVLGPRPPEVWVRAAQPNVFRKPLTAHCMRHCRDKEPHDSFTLLLDRDHFVSSKYICAFSDS